MEMTFIVLIIATNITLLQIKYFQNYKKLIYRITSFAIASWFLVLILYGIISGRAKENFHELNENYPVYLIVLVIAITIQYLIARNSKDKKDDKEN